MSSIVLISNALRFRTAASLIVGQFLRPIEVAASAMIPHAPPSTAPGFRRQRPGAFHAWRDAVANDEAAANLCVFTVVGLAAMIEAIYIF